jgi:hypothetical protein
MCTCVECAGYQQEAGEDAERFFPFEFEVWQDDVMVASASGPREDALREAMHYAAQYQQDGPVRVFEVTRTLVRPNAPVHRREASDGTGS